MPPPLLRQTILNSIVRDEIVELTGLLNSHDTILFKSCQNLDSQANLVTTVPLLCRAQSWALWEFQLQMLSNFSFSFKSITPNLHVLSTMMGDTTRLQFYNASPHMIEIDRHAIMAKLVTDRIPFIITITDQIFQNIFTSLKIIPHVGAPYLKLPEDTSLESDLQSSPVPRLCPVPTTDSLDQMMTILVNHLTVP